ncbi:MAG: hypothetical protein NVSMB18_26890 [Acetobacteraceae bacterium]
MNPDEPPRPPDPVRLEQHVERSERRVRALEVSRAELRAEAQAARAELDAVRADLLSLHARLEAQQRQREEIERRAADLEQELAAVHRSTSWRLTGPLRGLFETARAGRGGAVAVADQPPTASARLAAPPRLWLHLGDAFERLHDNAPLTDASRVTAELFFASLAAPVRGLWFPCTQADGDLHSLSLRDCVAYLAARIGAGREAELLAAIDPAAAPPLPSASPESGDHVLFTDLAGTPAHAALLRRLAARGVRFSVLIHDLLPMTRAGGVGPEPAAAFAQWLETVAGLASVVFVPSRVVGEQIGRWSALSARPAAALVTLPLGTAPDWPASIAAIGRAAPVATPPPATARHVRPLLAGIATPPIQAVLAAEGWCTATDPEVSIVIINWNAAAMTCECVRQLLVNTTGVRFEILIVDNGSDDREVEWLRGLGEGVRVLALGTNRYFGEANNIAVQQARGRLVCLLNNDAFVEPGWLAALRDGLAEDPSAGAAGPLFLFPDGTIQEAGAQIDERGFSIRFQRGIERARAGTLAPGAVDYISAAALLLPRDLFLEIGGFDLTFEPAYYEDADLCFKIRARGRTVRFCPEAVVVHIEGAAANGDPVSEARRHALGDLNRDKFVSRWGGYLRERSEAELQRVARQCGVHAAAPPVLDPARPLAALFTPYALTPGDGEHYLLTIAARLARDHAVAIVTPLPYSRLRLLELGHGFGLDLSGCVMLTSAGFAAGPDPDVMVTMGNTLVPPIAGRGGNGLHLCEFPFSRDDPAIPTADTAGYRAVLVYSDYVRAHVTAGLSAYQLPSRPVRVVYPPVVPVHGDASRKRRMILSVGRFGRGDHATRHHAMIATFRRLLETVESPVELHLAGSSMPEPEHRDELAAIQRAAADLPVVFHIDPAPATMAGLFGEAAVYWHAAGLGADLASAPGHAEPFGISIVEAMSAQCIPVVFNAGGPREIITPGVDGFLFDSQDEMLALTRRVLDAGPAEWVLTMARQATRRAADFSPERFAAGIAAALQPEPTGG